MVDSQDACENLFTEPVEFYVNVFGASMVNWVVSQRTGRLVVNEENSRYGGVLQIKISK